MERISYPEVDRKSLVRENLLTNEVASPKSDEKTMKNQKQQPTTYRHTVRN